MNNISEIFYNILFHPVKTFREFPCEKPYKLPLLLVFLSSIFLLLLSEDSFGFMTLLSFMFKAINLVIYWLFFAFFVDLMARMFNIQGNYAKLLTLTAFSFVPWIFLAPLKLLKNAGYHSSDVAVTLILCVWIWTIALQVLAISETYNIPRKNAIMIILIPFLGCILYFIWAVDFFVKLFQISGM